MFFGFLLSISVRIPLAVPISVPISSMIINGNYMCSSTPCDQTTETYCGEKCWSIDPNTASFEYTFKGEMFEIYGKNNHDNGNYLIYLDGDIVATIDQNQPEETEQIVQYRSDVLPYGLHTIKAVGKGDKAFEIYKFTFWPSIYARRLNMTDMQGSWISQSDNIGGYYEYTNSGDVTKTATIHCSKIWVYGAIDPNHGDVQFLVDQQNFSFSETGDSRVNLTLLKETSLLNLNEHTISFRQQTSGKQIHLNFIYYLPNTYSGTSYYINNSFSGNLNPAQIEPISEPFLFYNCKFTDITVDKNFYIHCIKSAYIHNSTFENSQPLETHSRPAVMWFDSTTSNLYIYKCKFYRISCKNNDNGNVIHCNNQNGGHILIEKSEFLDCGRSGKALIYLNHESNSIKLYDCNFSFVERSSGDKVLNISNNNAEIDGCRFEGCGADAILLSEDGNDNPEGVFNFTNNYVTSNKGKIIKAEKLRAKPNIINNTFENSDISNTYYISIIHDQQEIELINNTFSHMSSVDPYNATCGGLNILIQSTFSEPTIKFQECKFYDIINKRVNNLYSKGGALRFGSAEEGNNYHTHFEFIKCDFKRNKAQDHGGAICIRTSKNITISECIFEMNMANGDISNSKSLLADDNHGCGGAIYLITHFTQGNDVFDTESVNINNCNFIKNQAYEGFSIYLECGCSCNNLNLINNTFNHDQSQQSSSINQNCNSGIIYINMNIDNSHANENFEINSCNFINNQFNDVSNNFSNIQFFYPQLSFQLDLDIKNCIFEQSPFYQNNGALFIDNKFMFYVNSFNFINCTFRRNTGDQGGAISINFDKLFYFIDCYFISNTANSGGAFNIEPTSSSDTENEFCISNCSFIDNLADQSGGSIYLKGSNSNEISNCHFINCYSNGDGNSLKTDTSVLNLYIHDCEFINCGKGGHAINFLGTGCNIQHNNFTCSSASFNNGGIQINSDTEFTINNCSFIQDINNNGDSSNSILLDNEDFSFDEINRDQINAILISQNGQQTNQATITNCLFDGFTNGDSCFKLSIKTNNFRFDDNTIKNMISTDNKGYFGYINGYSIINELTISRMHFINNVGKSFFGGGCSLLFYEINNLKFDSCYFTGNKAEQDSTISRPVSSADSHYYNGDGGAIQLGYLCPINNVNVIFDQCEFSKNTAYRHGGAIAIQTLGSVDIIGCTFTENTADNTIEKTNLLENHYDLKKEGRGGAIYINPNYDQYSLCQSSDLHMNSINIDGCTFTSNKAYDGYAMYIEGEEKENQETTFTIINNNFNNNYNLETLGNNYSIIATEICDQSLSYETIVKSDKNNTFSNQKDGQQIYVLEVSCVDFYGRQVPSKVFSESYSFSYSAIFSKTIYFTNSKGFTETGKFSKSNVFSDSKKFSYSQYFTQSIGFSGTKQFSKSSAFTNSDKFSETSQFSKTDSFSASFYFTQSNNFSKSDDFSKSNIFPSTSWFTLSNMFSKSNDFSESNYFTKSNDFSESNYFTKSNDFSHSSIFSQSNDFSRSDAFLKTDEFSRSKDFSNTIGFTKSNDFSHSSMFSASSDFTISYKFSKSEIFTESSKFSKSDSFSSSLKFTNSVAFTKTEGFSNSDLFSSSSEFSNSNYFSKSNVFSRSDMFSNTKEFSHTDYFSDTNAFSKSNDFTNSNLFTTSKEFSQSNQFSTSEHFSKTGIFSNTGYFSFSDQFSYSCVFSISDPFEPTLKFTVSKGFSSSEHFTETSFFSQTKEFSYTVDFSKSKEFTISNTFVDSSIFTNSNHFSDTNYFSNTDHFTRTNDFSHTDHFSNTNDFSFSYKFTKSTDFSRSGEFSTTNIFSSTEYYTKSVLFSFSSQFSTTKHFSFSDQFTETNKFTLTSKFSETNKFSKSNTFTNSNQFSSSHDFTDSYQFTESYQFTPSIKYEPMNPACIISSNNKNTTQNDRCDYTSENGEKVEVLIISSNFTDCFEESDGAAIRVINCEINCNGTYFVNCVSKNGGGGGIYVKNDYEMKNNIIFENLTFIQCKALYGGAIYIYSSYESNYILIRNCTFSYNMALGTKNSNIYGGSSIYMQAKNAKVTECNFEHGKGIGGSFKISDIFDGNERRNKQLEETEKIISISGCNFEQEEKTNSIFYVNEKNSNRNEINIVDCKFKGKLSNGNHYIDGNGNVKDIPIFNIQSCEFEYELKDSVKSELIKESAFNSFEKKPSFTLSSKRKFVFVILFVSTFSLMILFVMKYKLPNQTEADKSIYENADNSFEIEKGLI